MISSCVMLHSIVLEDNTCKPPCWKNIHPGVTKANEAVQILGNMEEVFFPSFYETDINKGKGSFTFLFTGRIPESSGKIYFQDQLVTKIEFDTERITLGDAVDKLGNPEQFLAVSGWADSKWLEIFLIYPSSGVIVTFFKSNIMWSDKGQFDLTSDKKVWSVIYFAPELYDEVLKIDVLNRSVYDDAILIDSIQEWQGFGTIDYYDPE